jgi:transposase, IS30 family
MDQTAKHPQLQPDDRMKMATMNQQGSSARSMARALGRNPSTMTSQLARNTLTAMPYGSHTALVASFSRRMAVRRVATLAFDGLGWCVVRTLLDWKWSPQQIAAALKRVFADEPERHVRHETIDTAIYAQPGDLLVLFQSGAYGATPCPQGFPGHPAVVEVLV